MNSHIKQVLAEEVSDSRGNPTVQANVILGSGVTGTASVPSDDQARTRLLLAWPNFSPFNPRSDPLSMLRASRSERGWGGAGEEIRLLPKSRFVRLVITRSVPR